MKAYSNIIKHPILTEKTNFGKKENKYYFKVDKKVNKTLLKKAFENLFKVVVLKCNIINVKGKKIKSRYGATYRAGYKKVVVTVKEGSVFDFYEGV